MKKQQTKLVLLFMMISIQPKTTRHRLVQVLVTSSQMLEWELATRYKQQTI